MKITSTKIIENSNIPPRLVRSTVRQLGGCGSLKDIANYGAGGGYHGFIYYYDTVAFFNRNRHLIIDLAKHVADENGEDVFTMITGFVCLKDMGLSATDVAEAIYRDRGDCADIIKNALTWFALEEVARAALYTLKEVA